jgi:hypothetical protein
MVISKGEVMVYYAQWGDSDTGESQVDYDAIQDECDQHTLQIHIATGDNDVVIGINPNGRYDYEIWADGGFFYEKRDDGVILMKPVYFSGFEALRERCLELQPNANWEEIGWR